ncbi:MULTISPECIES: hypothetical protein [unclassified Nonomuraea]|uniref:hypothetical protein n=1 Tax=unclassified Nonomuraea TaxID=2593643 RepID=UPI003401F072
MEETLMRRAFTALLGSLFLAVTLVASAGAAGAQSTDPIGQAIGTPVVSAERAGPRCPSGWYYNRHEHRCVRSHM